MDIRVKKRHTLKSQVVIDQETKEIICTAHDKGKEHDFRWFKVRLKKEITCLRQGMKKLHPNSRNPKKKPRGSDLSAQDKKLNRELARLRVVGERVNRMLKILGFCQNFIGIGDLGCFNLIADMYNYNYELNLRRT